VAIIVCILKKVLIKHFRSNRSNYSVHSFATKSRGKELLISLNYGQRMSSIGDTSQENSHNLRRTSINTEPDLNVKKGR